MFWSSSAFETVCAFKQEQRQASVEAASELFSSPLTASEEKLHALPISELVSGCKSGDISPSEIISAYGKKALVAQRDTNCIAELMINEAITSVSAVSWGSTVDTDSYASDLVSDRPLLGVPLSVKDCIDIAGHDTTIGFARRVGKPVERSSAIVRLLQDAGAIIIAKTTVPTALFSVDTDSKLFGITSNPYSSAHGVGASTGGGAAMVACGGSKVEIGSDVAGSVRFPAHFCGVWSLKGSVGRWPVTGNHSSMMGVESVQTLTGPLARNLDDLEEVYKCVIDMKPWEYDYTCVPIPWRPVNLREEGRRLKWGIVWEDGVIPPSPACRRALSMVADSLRTQGHEVVDLSPPNIPEFLEVGYQLAFGDAGQQIRDTLLPSETVNPALGSFLDLVNLPRFFKKMLAMFYSSTDPIYANLLNVIHPKTIAEERALIVRRDQFRAAWHDQWAKEGLDFVLTVTAPFPAVKHGEGLKASLMTASYAFLFNLLDYSAGNIPVTRVDKDIDSLPADFMSSPEYKAMNMICKTSYSVYDAESMHGLPVGVQIVGRRLEEEKVLEGMKVIRSALIQKGIIFEGR
ncbi:amidase signature domain-containing protein [Rhodocollybia butyracea]|uniref:Amidase signature domain-containing protein n=1 Tax=Rhodocollybia butyracea TaxID=206335 RepID=A0A9P5Q0D9_9AGAR|nr:amidase signature domain-containing protein [Rhodocollybia butyracea]